MNRKIGISLTVLVITIIVMIVLATTVIISLTNTDIVDKTGKVVKLTNEEEVKEQAIAFLSDIVADRSKDDYTTQQIEQEVKQKLTEQFGEDITKNYNIKYDEKNEDIVVEKVEVASNDDWEVSINQSTGYGTIVGYKGEGGNVTIPSTVYIDGKKIKIKTIDILGVDMQKVNDDVEKTGEPFSLEIYKDLSYAVGNIYKITSATIEEGIEDISLGFAINLESVSLPSTTKEIKMMTGCFKLKSLAIPESVTDIGEFAFGFCTLLKNITFQNNIQHMGAVAFNECGWYYEQPEGPIYAGNVFVRYKGTLTEDAVINIKEGTTVIADAAFSKDRGNEVNESNTITDVVLPSTIRHIGEYAFGGFRIYRALELPEGLISIGKMLFYRGMIEGITIPSSVEYIGKYAFADIGYPYITITIKVNKKERDCDEFDGTWDCKMINNSADRHNVEYLPD